MNKSYNIKVLVHAGEDIGDPQLSALLAIQTARRVVYSSDEELTHQLGILEEEGYRSKEVLVLQKFSGRLLQECPGSPGMICCRYRLINTCFNCLYNCGYCYLNTYLNWFGIRQFTNYGKLIEEIDNFHQHSDFTKIYRIGTGEFTDSLMIDEATGIGKMLIEHCSRYKNIMLELKTKSSNISHLLDITERGNAVLSWTLNTERNIRQYEEGAATLRERLEAAALAVRAGYYVAFHFDPIITYPEWKRDYEYTIALMADTVGKGRVVWISLGGLRFIPSFKTFIRERNSGSDLALGEFFPGRDGKLRYLKQFRKEIYAFMRERIRNLLPEPFIYMCMESREMWEDVFGLNYNTSDELEADFSGHMKSLFLKP